MGVSDMVRNDLREHSHTGQGDGGEIEGIGEGGPTEVASGETAVESNSTLTVQLSAARDSDLYLAAYPDTAYSGTVAKDDTAQMRDTTGGVLVALRWNTFSGDGWEILFEETEGSAATIHWTVYEL